MTLVLGPSTGGIGQHIRSLASRLTAAGCVVRVAGPVATQERFGFGDHAEFVPLELPAWSAVRQGRRVLVDADVLHAHGHTAGVIAAAATFAHQDAPALVVTWHNAVLSSGFRRTALELAQRWVARRTRVLLGASADLVDEARRLGARDARFVPVAAPVLAPANRGRAEARTALGLAERPMVLAIGRLAPQKRYDVLLDGLARLVARDAIPPLLVIAGEGPERTWMAERIARDKLPALLLGHRSDLPNLLTAADAVVLTSQWEARALAAQEALRAGVPLVATGVGGIPDLVGDAALLVPPDDPEALAVALAQALEDPGEAKRLRAAGPRQAATWPGEDDTAAQIIGLYRELI